MIEEIDIDEERYKLDKMKNLMGDAEYDSGKRNRKAKWKNSKLTFYANYSIIIIDGIFLLYSSKQITTMNVLVHKEEKMEKPNIVDIKTKTIIDPTKLFGKDANRLLKACNIAFENGLLSNQYKGCYRSFSHPRLEDVRKKFNSAEGENLAVAYKIALAEWESANPKEATKERKSRENWEYNRDKQFRIIYGIAKRHGLYIRWLGTQFCDQWTIYKRNEPIARIYCV